MHSFQVIHRLLNQMGVTAKPMTFGPPWGQGQHRVETVKAWTWGFSLRAEHRGVAGRVDIQPDDVSQFLSNSRVIGDHLAF